MSRVYYSLSIFVTLLVFLYLSATLATPLLWRMLFALYAALLMPLRFGHHYRIVLQPSVSHAVYRRQVVVLRIVSTALRYYGHIFDIRVFHFKRERAIGITNRCDIPPLRCGFWVAAIFHYIIAPLMHFIIWGITSQFYCAASMNFEQFQILMALLFFNIAAISFLDTLLAVPRLYSQQNA